MDKIVRIKIDRDIAADNVIYADTNHLRRKGVLQREEMAENEGVLLVMPPRPGLFLFYSIHMFGVPFEIAAAWLNHRGEILDLKKARPGRIYFPSGFLTHPTHILELHPAHLPQLRKAERVSWELSDG